VSSSSRPAPASEASDSEVEKPEGATKKRSKASLVEPAVKRSKSVVAVSAPPLPARKKSQAADSMPMIFESDVEGESGESTIDATLAKAVLAHTALATTQDRSKSKPSAVKSREDVGDALTSRAHSERKRFGAAQDLRRQTRKGSERSERRRGRSRRESDSYDDSDSDESQVFRSGSSRVANLKDLARKREGALLKSGLLRESGWMKQQAIAFLHQVVYVRHPLSVMGLRDSMQFNQIQCKPMQSNVIQCNPMQFQGLFLVAVHRN
jgi:hypothetical protein